MTIDEHQNRIKKSPTISNSQYVKFCSRDEENKGNKGKLFCNRTGLSTRIRR